MKTFSHSGDLGDIVYALPTIANLGGGHLVLGPRIKVRVAMTLVQFNNIAPLLRCQSYLAKVSYCLEPGDVNYNLDQFRRYWAVHLWYGKSIAQFHAEAFNTHLDLDTKPWLFVDMMPKFKSKLVVISRSARYHNSLFPWAEIVKTYQDWLVFVGTFSEWKDFCNRFGTVEYYPTVNLLDVARLIATCDLFIGNQSCPYAIAEGLKKSVIQEVYIADPNCMFNRSNAQYATGRHIEFPAL
jgi:hypothetical protein